MAGPVSRHHALGTVRSNSARTVTRGLDLDQRIAACARLSCNLPHLVGGFRLQKAFNINIPVPPNGARA